MHQELCNTLQHYCIIPILDIKYGKITNTKIFLQNDFTIYITCNFFFWDRASSLSPPPPPKNMTAKQLLRGKELKTWYLISTWVLSLHIALESTHFRITN